MGCCCCKNWNKNDANENCIFAEITINEKNVNKEIRIINTFEESKREHNWPDKEDDYKYKNEKKIKDCTIIINDKIIDFNYVYTFNEKGIYEIKYFFKKNIKNVAFIFSECHSLTNIDLSNFNTQNVTNMNNMFSGCKTLTYINMSSFNTQNVTDMNSIFFGCNSLTNINLSNFNTQKVIVCGNCFIS